MLQATIKFPALAGYGSKLILVLLLPGWLAAQPSVKEGTFKSSAMDDFVHPIGEYQQQLFAWEGDAEIDRIWVLDQNFEQATKYRLKPEKEYSKYKPFSVRLSRGQLHIYYSHRDEYKKKVRVGVRSFNTNLTPVTTFRQLVELDLNPTVRPRIEVHTSKNQAFTAVFVRHFQSSSKPRQDHITLLDSNLAVIYSKLVSNEASDIRRSALDVAVSDQGGIFLLHQLRPNMGKALEKKSTADAVMPTYYLEKISPHSQERITFPAMPEGQYFNAIDITLDSDSTLLLYGLYANNGSPRHAGYCYSVLDQATLLWSGLHQAPLTDKELLLGLSADELKKRDRALEGGRIIRFDEVLYRINRFRSGEVAMVLEKYYLNVPLESAHFLFTGTPGFESSGYERYFRHLIVTRFDAKGQVKWKHIIPKNQYSKVDNGVRSSLTSFTVNETLGILFNGSEANNTCTEGCEPSTTPTNKPQPLIMLSIDADGTLERSTLQPAHVKVPFNVRFADQVNASALVIMGSKGQTRAVRRIEF